MKKYIVITIAVVLSISLLVVYKMSNTQTKNEVVKYDMCNINQEQTDSYSLQVVDESATYKVENKILERQATDGSDRKIYTDKNYEVVLIQDKHSGETGFRVVSVILKSRRVIKVIDTYTKYKVPPIEDPNSVPTITKDEFYVKETNLCKWYKEGKLMDKNTSNEQEYLNVIKWIVNDAENVAKG